jgi:hypothetical protein
MSTSVRRGRIGRRGADRPGVVSSFRQPNAIAGVSPLMIGMSIFSVRLRSQEDPQRRRAPNYAKVSV